MADTLYDSRVYPVSQKLGHFYFYHNSAKVNLLSYFFTVKFRKDLRRKVQLKLPPPLKSVAALAKNKCSTIIQLYIHTNESKMIIAVSVISFIRLFIFFLSDIDVRITLLRYFVFLILHYSCLSVMKIG